MSDQTPSIGFSLGWTAKLLTKMVEKRLSEHDIHLNANQMGLLMFLSSQDLMIQQDLAEIMDKHKSIVLRIIDSLEERKFIIRTPDPDDRRKKIIAITRSGHQLLARIREVEKEVSSLLQEGLTEEEIINFTKVSQHIQERAKSLTVANSN